MTPGHEGTSSRPITALFFDLGGVVLTNGWDRTCRRQLADQFELAWPDFADRHDFEVGHISLQRAARITRTAGRPRRHRNMDGNIEQ